MADLAGRAVGAGAQLSVHSAPPTPVPSVMPRTSRSPAAAPHAVSPRTKALTSLSRKAGTPSAVRRAGATGKPAQSVNESLATRT
ncbi:hypothetical protein SVIOM342S_02040 [Streptomyces violaceorubidus]